MGGAAAVLLLLAAPALGQTRDLQRIIQDLRSSPRYRPPARPARPPVTGSGGLRLQSERGPQAPPASRRQGAEGPPQWWSSAASRRMDAGPGRLARRVGPGPSRRTPASRRAAPGPGAPGRRVVAGRRMDPGPGKGSGLQLLLSGLRAGPAVLASLLPGRAAARPPHRAVRKGGKGAKGGKRSLRKPVDRSKFSPPADMSHGFEPFFRESPAFEEGQLSQAATARSAGAGASGAGAGAPGAGSSLRPSAATRRHTVLPFFQEGARSLQGAAEGTGRAAREDLPRGPAGANTFNEEIFHENSNIDGFFEGVEDSFPRLEDFGSAGWESRKLASWRAAVVAEQEEGRAGRRRRAAFDQPLYYSRPVVPRQEQWRPRERFDYAPERPEQGGGTWERRGSGEWGLRRPEPGAERYEAGPAGFWEEEEYDSGFFSAGQRGAGGRHSAYEAALLQAQEAQEAGRLKRRPSYRPHSQPYKRYDVENNEILGSGNFDIVKGGTFYPGGDYQYRFNSNKPAPSYNYYGGNDYFENFRDFADIKGKAAAQRY